MRKKNIAAVEKYLDALRGKDLSLAPLADDLKFDDPIAGHGIGAENFRAFLSGFLPAIMSVELIQHVCDGEYVVTHFEADTVFGKIKILEKFRVQNGQITEAEGFYDPRLIIG